jgi:hypothetical protein
VAYRLSCQTAAIPSRARIDKASFSLQHLGAAADGLGGPCREEKPTRYARSTHISIPGLGALAGLNPRAGALLCGPVPTP